MKIIGHSSDGYLIDVSKYELQSITGKKTYNTDTYRHDHALPIGTEITAGDAIQHITKVTRFEDQRIAIANQLRAAATVIETTPSVLSLPEQQGSETSESA